VLLSAGTDNWTSLTLGFGTTSFARMAVPDPKVIVPDRLLVPEFDYMVSATYHLPFGLEMNLAAIAALARVLRYPRCLAAKPISASARSTEAACGECLLRWLRSQAPGLRAGDRLGSRRKSERKADQQSFTPFLPAAPGW
jgi:hypothetical protein